jgi:trk system potassium uptake protein
MEYKPLARALSVLLAIVSLFMALCAVAGVLLGEGVAAFLPFVPSFGVGLACAVLIRFSRGDKIGLSPRAGYLFVTLSWVFAAVLGATPFVVSGYIPSWFDAVFEAMSGFTTTGATILSDIERLPDSLLLWRATTHWLGGMGIVVLTVAVFPLLGINGRALMEAESPGPQVEKFTPRLSQTASILWFLYCGLTVICVVLLMFGGMGVVDAVCHAFAAMGTGGYSTKNLSVGAFGSAYVEVVLTAFMILAGSNFAIYWKMLSGKFRIAARDAEWRVYLGIIACSSLAIALNLLASGTYASFGQALRYAAFQVATIITTTGFATADYLRWPFFSQTVLFLLMFIGGCAGSTAGGIKVGRALTMLKMGFSEMKYLLNPRGVYGIFVNGQYMHKNVVYDIAAMVFLYFVTALASTLVVSIGGYDIMTCLSATLATLGNIGPGFSLVGPAFNYGFFPGWIKLWLTFVMLVGRLEVYTVLVLFTRAFWKR